MALDLALSVVCLSLGAVLFFLATAQICREVSERQRQFAALSIVICGALYGVFGWDQVWLSRLIPSSAVIVLGNWFPLFAAALAGVVVRVHDVPRWRRGIATFAVLAVGAYSTIFPLLGSTPTCADHWRESICLQSTPFTCSAASAATLLRAHGIEATEQEMAQLCLTSHERNGTSWQGVFRGLSLKTEGTQWRVEVFQAAPTDLATLSNRPTLLVACLPTDDRIDPIYREACGWIPGQPHAVVFFELRDDQTAIIGDPQFGRELWTRSDLSVLWSGLGFRLVPVAPTPRP